MSTEMRLLLSRFSNDLAIDLGTANTLVFARGRGIVVSEPSIIAVNQKTGMVEAVGREAKDMLGRTPANILAIRPIKDGVIADFEHTQKMLDHFIRKAHGGWMGLRPRIVIGVPSQITQVERRAVMQAAHLARASKVYLVEQTLLAALGTGLQVMEPSGSMVVDIGGGTTDVAVIALGGIILSRSVRVAGNRMDEDIVRYIKRKHNLLLGERMAEDIKMTVGSASTLETELTMWIKGRDLVEGMPRTLMISDREIREALSEAVSHIVEAVLVVLEQTPPELSSDLVGKGIMLTGGGSLLKGLDTRLREETGLGVSLAEDPLTSVVRGGGMLLSDFALLEKMSLDTS
jgi:rod shape-determining protein MreB and related proteins